MNSILVNDINNIVDRLGTDWQKFANKTVLVTGATGLIGSLLARVFLLLNTEKGANVKIILSVRSAKKLEETLGHDECKDVIVHEQESIADPIELSEDIDYIIHTAAPASSKYFVEEPVETLDAIINGSRQVLELARKKKVKSIVLMSSMEAYGRYDDVDAKEHEHGYIDLNNVRNSYTIGKRAGEFFAYAYSQEYGVPTVSIRLAMCFGAGQKKTDTRVHRAFCEAAINGKDVVVKSTGKTTVNFVYSADAVLAILMCLLHGKHGETYNVAGDSMEYTIMDMAKYVAEMSGTRVVKEIDASNLRIAKDSFMRLNTDKIKSLGWLPNYNIQEALMRYMDYLKSEINK